MDARRGKRRRKAASIRRAATYACAKPTIPAPTIATSVFLALATFSLALRARVYVRMHPSRRFSLECQAVERKATSTWEARARRCLGGVCNLVIETIYVTFALSHHPSRPSAIRWRPHVRSSMGICFLPVGLHRLVGGLAPGDHLSDPRMASAARHAIRLFR